MAPIPYERPKGDLKLTASPTRRGTSRAQVGQDGQDSAVVVSRRLKLQLAKDAVDVGFDGLGAEKELLADRRVGAALGHQREDLLLPLGEVRGQVVRSPPGDHLGH